MIDYENKPFPNPEGKLNVIKRYLHILALLQYIPDGDNPETWNARSLADILSLDETGTKLPDDGLVRIYIKEHIEKELDISVDKKQGGLFSTLAEDIDVETQLKIARVYADFVIKDTTRDMILKKFIESMEDRALWTLARIYFAVIEQRMIKFNYITNSGHNMNGWELCPYYFVMRNNSLYLAAWDPSQKKNIIILAERIKDLTVLPKNISKEWDIPDIRQLFRYSLSAFISDDGPIEMKIRYAKHSANIIESIISPLDPLIKPAETKEWFESAFFITDYIYLCKQLVLYGNEVEILSPPHVRQAMINMLKESLGVYEK